MQWQKKMSTWIEKKNWNRKIESNRGRRSYSQLPNKQYSLLNVFWKSAKLSCSSEVMLIKVQGGVNVYMRYEINVQGCFELWLFEVENQVSSQNQSTRLNSFGKTTEFCCKQDMINKAPFLLIEPYEQYQVFMSMTVIHALCFISNDF